MRKVAFRIVGGITLVVGSFFATLFVMDWMNYSPSSGSITILEASYGSSCTKKTGNVTDYTAKACNGKQACSMPINVNLLGDPSPGCGKDFAVTYQCGQNKSRGLIIPPESNGKTLTLDCTKG
jgi:hypothetical protein